MKLEDEELKAISETVYDESMRYNVDYRLVLAIMKVKSNFRYDAVSAERSTGTPPGQAIPGQAYCRGCGHQVARSRDPRRTGNEYQDRGPLLVRAHRGFPEHQYGPPRLPRWVL